MKVWPGLGIGPTTSWAAERDATTVCGLAEERRGMYLMVGGNLPIALGMCSLVT